MKIIQSFWTKPAVIKNKDNDGRYLGGWKTPKAHMMSWTLSCLSLKEHYSRVELYTDLYGKKLLIDELNLPYDSVHTDLENINCPIESLWTYGKIYTYGLQKEPFIHVDGDIFIYDTLFNPCKDDFYGQNLEINLPFYKDSIEFIKNEMLIPNWLYHYLNINDINTINTGIIGGFDISFFKKYTEIITQLILDNRNVIESQKINTGLLAITLEQLVYYALIKRMKKRICYKIKEPNIGNFFDLTRFYEIPKHTKYIHVIGSQNKKSINNIECIESLLRSNYLTNYYQLIQSNFI